MFVGLERTLQDFSWVLPPLYRSGIYQFLSAIFTIGITSEKVFFTISANFWAKIGGQTHLKFGIFSTALSAHVLSECVTIICVYQYILLAIEH